MVCTVNDLQGWKDFPKGLKVLLLDEDTNSACEMKSKLEAMDYIVSMVCNETEALSAILNRPKNFHVAIVEVNAISREGSFKLLEIAKDLPTIMISNTHCLNTMMKCIANGAVEFLQKPLSEEKLKNIWQHVLHKVFNAGANGLSESLKPVKESLLSMLQQRMENGGHETKVSVDLENVSRACESENEISAGSDKYPAPSTPQLKQGARLLDRKDCQDQTNCSMEKEIGEQDGESKSVETIYCNMIAEGAPPVTKPEVPGKTLIKEEEDFADGSKSESTISPHLHKREDLSNVDGSAESPCKAYLHGGKASRKKTKVDWTPELHKKFVQAVEQLGVDKAIPSKILQLMKVEGLTRHNVASHLQKYRMHKRHISPKEEDCKWLHHRYPRHKSSYPQGSIMAFPTYHSSIHALYSPPVYPVWGQAGTHPAAVPMWAPSGYPPWQPTLHADVWGCPVMPSPQVTCTTYPQNRPVFHTSKAVEYSHHMQQNSIELHPADEVIDKVVKEAVNKPWLPLPIGLKPPSTDSVLAELYKQGISHIPPASKASN